MSARHWIVAAALLAVFAAGVVYFRQPAPLPVLSPVEYVARGTELTKQGDHREAIRYHTAALEKEPRNTQALAGRAEAYVSAGEYELALRDFDNAIHFAKGTERRSFIRRAFLLDLFGEFDLALADANTAIKMDPKQADGFFMRAVILQHPEKGNPARSREDFDRAVALNPGLRERARELGF